MEFSIDIAESSVNQRGDLFGRLLSELFVSLGFDHFGFNVQMAGREIDIMGRHRHEARYLIAECKTVRKPIGGDAINKFVGVLDAERRKRKQEIVGYFISLHGFRQTALEQERSLGESRLVLLNGHQVVEELIKGHLIAPPEKAIGEAAVAAAAANSDLTVARGLRLLGTEWGWMWIVEFGRHVRALTHFAVVHADGRAIAPFLAEKLIEKDPSGRLATMRYLPPADAMGKTAADLLPVRQMYFRYLQQECGEITLDGLPADHELGSKRLRLEQLFVPQHLALAQPRELPEREIAAPREPRSTRHPRFGQPPGFGAPAPCQRHVEKDDPCR